MALSLDGSVGVNFSSLGTGSLTLTLTTTQPNDVIIVAVAPNNTPVTSITDASGLTWIKRAQAGIGQFIYEYYAVSPLPMTSNIITVNFSGAPGFVTACAFGISGADTTAIFDSNPSLPFIANSGAAVVSTTTAQTMVIGLYRQSASSTPSAGTGFTAIYAPTGGFFIAEYQIVSSTQSSLSIGINGGTTNTNSNGSIGDAIIINGTPPTPNTAYQKYANGGHDVAQTAYLLVGVGGMIDWGQMPYGSSGPTPPPTPPSPETNSIGGGGGEPRRGNVYHSPGIHPHKAAEIKQQEIIAKRLEAQELLIIKKELQDLKDKQTARQKKVLETRYQGLLLEIHINNQELERLYIEYRNIQSMLALMMAMPWLNLGGETMH